MSAEALPFVSVFADESCLGNGRAGDNPGGAAGLIEVAPRASEPTRLDYWVSEPATTNNRMALRSAIEAFEILSGKDNRLSVRFTSDSQYLVKGMREWVPAWRSLGWRRKGGPIENLALWQRAVELAERHAVDWRWVRGHADHLENEYADHLATRAAREQSSSGGAVPSLYGEWLAARSAAGRRHGRARSRAQHGRG